jgi:hypothetical protein
MGLSIPKNKFYRFGGGLQFDLKLRVKKEKPRASKNLSGSQKQKKETP